MRRSGRPIRRFLLDTNVFIAAIKDPKKQTVALKLILRLIGDRSIELVGNRFLIEEMLRYLTEFRSETAATLLGALLHRTKVVSVRRGHVRACQAYFTAKDPIDVLNAATCLQAGATLISNDKDFNRIRDEGIIRVWTISKAVSELLR
ncbi:MAG: type II toxin-antitoxin system VapC family toxin [Candidatus Bathyarchaeia archaeon]